MRYSKDIFLTKQGDLILIGQNTKPPEGSKIWSGYDYEKQEWVYGGKKDNRTLEEIMDDVVR